MTDAHAAARTWLAERYRDAENLCDDSVCHECGGHPCEACVLYAILTAPGVEVQIAWAPYGSEAGTGRVMVMLPIAAQPIDGGCE